MGLSALNSAQMVQEEALGKAGAVTEGREFGRKGAKEPGEGFALETAQPRLRLEILGESQWFQEPRENAFQRCGCAGAHPASPRGAASRIPHP